MSPLCQPLKEEHEIEEEHTASVFDQYTGSKKFVCKICQNQFKNLLIHLKKSTACQTHYDMDTLQKQAKVKQKSKHTEAQASYRRRQLMEDPITFRQKHAMEQAASRLRHLEKDPVGTRAKHARVQAATRLRQLEKDPIGFRAKHARVQAATNKKNLEKDPIGTRAKHARVQAATRLKHLEKDPVTFRAKHARVQAATRLKNLEKDPIETNAAQEATEQTATGIVVSQYKPLEDVKTEQEEVQCSLLPDLDYIDGKYPIEFNISCKVSGGSQHRSFNEGGTRSPERNASPDSYRQHPYVICSAPTLDVRPLRSTSTAILTGASVQVPVMVQLKTEAEEHVSNSDITTNSLLNMPSPSPLWFATEDSESKPLLDSTLQRSVEQQNPHTQPTYKESQIQPAEDVKTEREEAPCSTYNLLLNHLPQGQPATLVVVPSSTIQPGCPVFGTTPGSNQVVFKW